MNLKGLNGEQWLRLLTLETNFTALVGWCPHCHGGERVGPCCRYCGNQILLFDDAHWDRVGSKIRGALRKDRTLLPRVKADREQLYGTQPQPNFPDRLSWLRLAWEGAAKPSHRPFEAALHYRMANCVQILQECGLSRGEIADVLGEEIIKAEPKERQRKKYGGMPLEDLRALRNGVRDLFGYTPGAALSVVEMGRISTWVNRQRAVPMARLNGVRVRDRVRTAKRGEGEQQ